jgi:hypothetical protein
MGKKLQARELFRKQTYSGEMCFYLMDNWEQGERWENTLHTTRA